MNFSMATRRKRKTSRGVSDYDELLDAIKDIKLYKKSVKSTATAHNIKRTSLLRYIAKFDAEVPEIENVDDAGLLKERGCRSKKDCKGKSKNRKTSKG